MKSFLISILVFIAISAPAQFNCQQTKSLKTSAASTPPINNNGKSDTLDILHIDLNMDMTLVHTGLIRGTATLTMRAKLNNINVVNLEFLNLHIDSVKYNDTVHCTYNFSSGPQFPINLPSTVNANDTFKLAVYYYGGPVQDASGWGGFHFNNPYYYNLGVGFAANPHNFGRAWFPCFDNFVERSTYSFHVKTSNGRKAYCNGIRTALDTTTFAGDTVVSHWEMTDEIPSYLASIAISNYQELRGTHNGMPSLLLARSNDTTKAKSTFANLYPIYDGFVANYGPYFWQKMGFAMTTIGAMEHATSIHCPVSLLNNGQANEDIIAHELAHHWFGNLITCETAGEMWINEGMAEYLSHQYTEYVYGPEAYEKATVDNHTYVIQYAAVADSGHYALTGLPNELTYGVHSYQKGALVGHNLRGYLGDTLFFNGLTQLLANNKFTSISSAQFRDQLASITGYNLTPFFDDWIFNPGYPDFDIDSMQVITSAIPERTVNIRISQRMLATNKRFTHVPLELTFHDDMGNRETQHVIFENADTTFTFFIPFAPTWATINESNHIFTATAARDYKVKTQQSLVDPRTKLDVYTGPVADSALVRIEHHWVGPSTTGNENFRVSTSRYWRVTGSFPSTFHPSGRLEYSSFANTGNLDEDLLANGEDSLMLVYRENASSEWNEFPFYAKDVMGNPNNKFGRINIQFLIPGEYAFANGVSAFNLEEEKAEAQFTLFPNPSSDLINIVLTRQNRDTAWQIIDVKGVVFNSGEIPANQEKLQLNIQNLAAGTYFFCAGDACQKFIKQ